MIIYIDYNEQVYKPIKITDLNIVVFCMLITILNTLLNYNANCFASFILIH